MKVVIVGGVAGGASAAARLRRLDEAAEIVMIERTGYVSYANCGLPYYVGGVITDNEIVMIERTGYVSYANCGLPYYVGGVITDNRKLTLQTPESFKARFAVDVRVGQEVVSIDRDNKRVCVRRLADGSIYEEAYDVLVLSPGARPAIPDIPGVDGSRVFALRTVEDAYAIKDFVDAEGVRSAVVVGAGFIGLETAENLRDLGMEVTVVQRGTQVMKSVDPDMAAIIHNRLRDAGGFIGLETAENLRDLGMEVTVVQRGTQVMKSVDPDMAAIIHNRLRDAGVRLLLSTHIEGVEEDGDTVGRAVRVLTAEHDPISCDMVVLAVGVVPDSSLAKDAGLEVSVRGSIKVDEHLRTSDPSIYAVGDAIEVSDVVTGEASLISLAGPANKQGRLAANNIAGRPRTYGKTLATSVLKLFDLTIAATGATSASARRAGADFDAVVLTPPNHATYYPGAQSMTLKVLFEKGTGRVIGAQAIGRDGVEKRIDVLATAIRAGMTASDLAELDLAYAPPFSSAKDPVNIAGFMIENIIDGLVSQVQWSEALTVFGEVPGTVLLDTRTEGEFSRGHVPGAVNIPLDELRERIGELPQDGMLFVYCQSGLRSYVACRLLAQRGFDCVNIAGGFGFGELPQDGMLFVYCQSGLRSYVACRLLAQRGFDCVNIAGGFGFLSHARRGAEKMGCDVGPCGLRA